MRFHAMGQMAAGQEHAPPTLQAFQANISPQADDFPIIASAGVRFAQTDMIVQLQVR